MEKQRQPTNFDQELIPLFIYPNPGMSVKCSSSYSAFAFSICQFRDRVENQSLKGNNRVDPSTAENTVTIENPRKITDVNIPARNSSLVRSFITPLALLNVSGIVQQINKNK